MSKKKAIKKTPPVEAVAAIKKVSKLVEGADAKVLINVFSPGHEPMEFRVSIPNIIGAANLLHRSPEHVAAAIISGLRAEYGERVG